MKYNMIDYNPRYKIIHSHYIDTDAFVSSIITSKNIDDLHNLSDFYDFSIKNKNHRIFSNKKKKVVGSFKK